MAANSCVEKLREKADGGNTPSAYLFTWHLPSSSSTSSVNSFYRTSVLSAACPSPSILLKLNWIRQRSDRLYLLIASTTSPHENGAKKPTAVGAPHLHAERFDASDGRRRLAGVRLATVQPRRRWGPTVQGNGANDGLRRLRRAAARQPWRHLRRWRHPHRIGRWARQVQRARLSHSAQGRPGPQEDRRSYLLLRTSTSPRSVLYSLVLYSPILSLCSWWNLSKTTTIETVGNQSTVSGILRRCIQLCVCLITADSRLYNISNKLDNL